MNAPYSLDAMIAAHIAQGYQVTFSVAPDGFFADLDKPGAPDAGVTSGGKTIGEALWAASPLHDDDEPFPGELPAPAVADDLRTLNADIEDFNDRLNVLEDRHDKFDRVEAVLVDTIVMLLEDQNPELRGLARKRNEEAKAGKAAPDAG